ncbi:unnamed protein product [Allacma fusca]|uniref:Uncharacterized protein n=1 Tax=Allacma fusca TaxID=39272 RepID=A0A8J2J7M7_9HEXA|nr:unnamed protein product [Allacma fusca]
MSKDYSAGLGTSSANGSSKSTLCLYQLTFLTFIFLTLLFLIITIGASESESDDFGLEPTMSLPNQTENGISSPSSQTISFTTDKLQDSVVSTTSNMTADSTVQQQIFTANLLLPSEPYNAGISEENRTLLFSIQTAKVVEPHKNETLESFLNSNNLMDLRPERIPAHRYNYSIDFLSKPPDLNLSKIKSKQAIYKDIEDQDDQPPEQLDWATRLLRSFGFHQPPVTNQTWGDQSRRRNAVLRKHRACL